MPYTIIADSYSLADSYKTALNVIASATTTFRIVELGISVDTDTGFCLVELVESTQLAAGTATTTGHKQIGGYRSDTDGTPESTYGREYSVDPSTLTVLKHWRFRCPGPLVVQNPIGRRPGSLLSGSTTHKALGIRMRLSGHGGSANVDAYLEFEE